MQSARFYQMHPLIPTHSLKKKQNIYNSSKIIDENYQPRNILIAKLIVKYYDELMDTLVYNYIQKCNLEEDNNNIIFHI
jgi:hypothetical protein